MGRYGEIWGRCDLASLLEIGRHALELDAGHYRPSGGSLALLYALRLLVRVQVRLRGRAGLGLLGLGLGLG